MVSMWLFVSCQGPWVGGVGEQTARRPFCTRHTEPWLGRLRCWYPRCVFVTLSKKASLLIVSRGGLKLSVCTAFPVPLTDPPSFNVRPIIPNSTGLSSLIAPLQSGVVVRPPPLPQSCAFSEGWGLASWPWEVG